jgi:hypothetical protein
VGRRSESWLRVSAIALVSLFVVSCGGSCRACLFGVTIAKDQGPPRAELVYTEHLSGGKAPGALPVGELHIESSPERKVTICNDEPKTGSVVVEPGGKRVAARCNQDPWKVVELGDQGRTFVFCQVEGDPTKDWKSAPTIEHQGADVLLCGTEYKTLLDELRARKVSERVLADTIFQASAYPGTNGSDRERVIAHWVEEYAALERRLRERVDEKLCPKLGEAEDDMNVNVADVAIRVCPLDDAHTIDAMASHAKELAKNITARGLYPALWYWSVLGAVKTKPAEMGAAVCATDDRDYPFGTAILAYTKAPCPEAKKTPATCEGVEAAIDELLAMKPPRPEMPRLETCETPED